MKILIVLALTLVILAIGFAGMAISVLIKGKDTNKTLKTCSSGRNEGAACCSDTSCG